MRGGKAHPMTTSQMSEVLQHLRRTVLLPDGAGLTDGQLLEAYLSRGSETALAALVGRHGPMVWGVCRRMLRNYHDAEDAFQATFLVLVRKAASILATASVGNWLYGVAHQTAVKATATTARRRVRERQVPVMSEPSAPEQDLWRDLEPLLDEEVARLPDKYRAVVVLCDLEGKSRKDAAGQLGCPEGTVAGRLARARRMLARRLTRRGVALSGGMLAAVLSQRVASAGVPISLVSSTIKTAGLLGAGTAATGAMSVKVAALAEGVLKAMLLTKLKTTIAGLLLVAALVSGAGAIYRTQAAGLGERPDHPPVPQKPADKNQRPLKVLAEEGARDGDGADARSGPTVSLARAVNIFNDRAAGDLVGKSQVPLTQDEVIAAIRWALLDRDKLLVSDETFAALARVADARELPRGFDLESLTGYEPNDRVEFTVWSVRLRIPSASGGTTCVTIREQMLRSRLIGEEERKVIHKWRGEKDPGSFARAQRWRQYQQERARAAQIDRSRQK
jgi:RNA polymerase sigma factor (sigma-70 family)